MASILTYQQILTILTSFTARHQMLNDLFIGPTHDFSLTREITYPALHVFIDSAVIPKEGESYPVIELSLACRVLDSQRQDDRNLQHAYSDCLQIAQDVINEISSHPFYIRSQAQLTNNVQVRPVERQSSDHLVGHEFNLDFRLINNNSFCGLPLEPIEGYSAAGAVSTGYSYSVQYLTCSSLRLCDSYQNIVNTSITSTGSSVFNVLSATTLSATTGNFSQILSGGTDISLLFGQGSGSNNGNPLFNYYNFI